MAKLVIVEGNISAGKSTLCRELASALGFELFLEPVVTNPYLEKYYAEPTKYGLAMQLWLLRQRFVMYARALRALSPADGSVGAKGVVLDRSLMSDIVFADKNLADGNITAEGYASYSVLRTHLLSLMPLPDAVVYLDATAQVCYDRIRLRSRDCESGIPLAYLAGLDECYDTFNADMKAKGAHVLSFDWRTFGSTTPAEVAAAVKALPVAPHALAAAPSRSEACNETVAGGVAALVASDESVLAALAALPAEVGACLAGLAAPDMADAVASLASEVANSEAEESIANAKATAEAEAVAAAAKPPAVVEEPKAPPKEGGASPKSVFDLTMSPQKA